MHDPICSFPMWSSTLVKDKGFLHPNRLLSGPNNPVFSCSLVIACWGCSVSAVSIGILPVTGTEEVPLLVITPKERLFCAQLSNSKLVGFMISNSLQINLNSATYYLPACILSSITYIICTRIIGTYIPGKSQGSHL